MIKKYFIHLCETYGFKEKSQRGGEQQKRNFTYRNPYLLVSTNIYDIFHNQFKFQVSNVELIFISVNLL